MCAALWLLPVVGFFVQSIAAWTADPNDIAADPHGYVGLFGLVLAVPALAFGACAVVALVKLARRRPGAGEWLLVVGILAGAATLMTAPGLVLGIVQPSPGTPGVDTTRSSLVLVGGTLAVVALAVATIVVALRVRRAERPLPPRVPVWPPVAPGR
ncbi:hypothetical protein GCM10022415_02590 [Knoellia locipacati]|uniref:Uncharacterized protein n=1 Tax=Knoellia locipacati TaxID=882824 RepID=A0A512SW82_9MICO|nr:hypothetical protein KLO01_02580 [Knoellia locipacati]